MSENDLINTCVWCEKSLDNAMELWDHCIGPWCGEWPDNLMMDTSDNEAMDGVDILTPEQFGVSKKWNHLMIVNLLLHVNHVTCLLIVI